MRDTVRNSASTRIILLDVARGVAFVAMAIFHFAFDLEMFGVVERGYTLQPEWKYFARSIASSFLFLIGFSLVLAHDRGMRWRAWIIRFLKIAAAALLVTIGTYFAIPDGFVFFGILHSIALSSLLALAFLWLPWWLNIAAALAVFALRGWGRTEFLDAPVWWWTGLSKINPQAVDYVPLFPWFGPVLLGVAAAQFCKVYGLLEKLTVPQFTGRTSMVLRFISRHSLVFYLLHQPVIIAVMYGFLFAIEYI